MNIRSIRAYQIFDSRGNPTVEAEVELTNGVRGHGIAPSGASIGQFEAVELRDGNPKLFRGKSVFKAVNHIEQVIAPALREANVFDQKMLDEKLIELDGTPNKGRLGANALLPVSMAIANAAAAARGEPLHVYLGGGKGTLLPVLEVQIIGGGAHANFRTDVQDFLLIAVGAANFDQVMEITHNVYHAAGEILRNRNQYFGVADEGGFWPAFERNEDALVVLVEAMKYVGYRPGREAAIALDIAASNLFDETNHRYRLSLENRDFSTNEFIDLITDWSSRFPIVSIEDPLADTDLDGWKQITRNLGGIIQVVGDDLFTTDVNRIRSGIKERWANAVLIKPNQIGTVTETIEAIRTTQIAGWQPIVSARSGDTEDTFITHLAVATNAGQLKVGAFSRSERMAKWNEGLRIQRNLGSRASFHRFAWPAEPPNIET